MSSLPVTGTPRPTNGLDAIVRTQLAQHLGLLRHDIELRAHLDRSPRSDEMRAVLADIAALSERVSLVEVLEDEHRDVPPVRRPSFAVVRRGDESVRTWFAGLPAGHEFTSLVLALLWAGGHPPRHDDATLDRIRAVPGRRRIETFYSQSCQNCPDVVQALTLASVLNPGLTHTAIDGAAFAAEAEARGVLSVPAVFVDGELVHSGRAGIDELMALLDREHAFALSPPTDVTEPFDVLVVGGGPAGAAAAVYAARKGVRTGLVAERLGGQVLDTLAIENLISVPRTDGPQLARALDAHVRQYDVEVIGGQRAVALHTSSAVSATCDTETGLGVELAAGVTLRAHTVVLAPGAAWRTLGVPGEAEYRNRGVTFCPHCDGPLFKGRRVAVIGGGNSGVEAALDLAGIVEHVTVVEFADELRADAVLRRALERTDNLAVITGAETTEVLGDGRAVRGLRYRDRSTGGHVELPVAGVFVQIGLVPATDWLAGVVERNERGEILVDGHGATNVPGVFAAGDATDSAYKQIVVALGSGATAALGAFDHLVRARADG